MRRWLREWWPLVILGVTVAVLVLAAYEASSPWNVEPLDGLATMGSLLLSVFLLYIYHRQNRILEQQQDIMESEEEISEASQVSPNLHVIWSLKEDSSLKLDMSNTGANDAYHITVHTRFEVLADTVDFEGGEWEVEAFRRVATGTDQDYLWDQPIRYDAFSDGEELEDSFSAITQELMRSVRSGDVDSVKVRVLVWLSFEDIRTNTDRIELVDHVLEVDGRMSLHASRNSEVETQTLVPRLRITEVGVFERFDGQELFGVEFRNVGGSPIDEFNLFSEVEVCDGSEWVSSDRFGFSGMELDYVCDMDLLQGELLFSWDGDEVIRFEELSERLLSQGFDDQMRIRIRVKYVDAAGNSGSDAVGVLGVVDFDVLSEPCNLYEIL